MEDKYYRIDEVAEKTGLTKRMLRYYEELEIINPIRKESNYRLYSQDDIEMLKSLRDIKDKLGFSMDELKFYYAMEKQINGVASGNIKDKDTIQLCKENTERMFRFVEEKENILLKVKTKLTAALEALNCINVDKEEQ